MSVINYQRNFYFENVWVDYQMDLETMISRCFTLTQKNILERVTDPRQEIIYPQSEPSTLALWHIQIKKWIRPKCLSSYLMGMLSGENILLGNIRTLAAFCQYYPRCAYGLPILAAGSVYNHMIPYAYGISNLLGINTVDERTIKMSDYLVLVEDFSRHSNYQQHTSKATH